MKGHVGKRTFVAVFGRVGAGANNGKVWRREEGPNSSFSSHDGRRPVEGSGFGWKRLPV